jgi:integrase
MPRRRSAPRLYLDKKRRTWIIRDGAVFRRTGCAESDAFGAERQLIEYLASKHKPGQGAEDPLILDILLAYASQHLPDVPFNSRRNATYSIADLSVWWKDKRLSEITEEACKAYAATRRQSWARKNLEVMRAAIRRWYKGKYRQELSTQVVWFPPKEQPRDRWLTRNEAARLLWAARRTPHLARFILLGLYTGSRSSVILSLQWSWIDLNGKVMLRRAPGTPESKKRTPPVRLGRRILAHLRRWRRLDGPHCVYVCHYDGKKIDRLIHSWPTAVARAGLGKDVTPHALRRTRATWVMQAGVDIWEAAGHLGMSPTILQTVYAKHHPDFQKRAAEV